VSQPINIQGTVIDYPSSAQSPNWAPAQIQFAEAVEAAFNTLVGVADIAPQVYSLPLNVNPTTSIPGLQFSTSQVRSAFVRYAVYRATNLTTVCETGSLQMVYNPTGSSTQKWEVLREAIGDASVTFSVTDVGQVQYSTTSLSGTSHVGTITFTGQALLQS
jgi:hypothetical protein